MPEETDIDAKNCSFEELWESLTRAQKRYVTVRHNCASKADAAQEVNLSPSTVYSWPERVEIAADRMLEETRDMVQAGIAESARKAVLRLPDLIESGDDKAAVRAAQYAIDQLIGKPTQKSEIDMDGEVNVESDSLEDAMDTLATAAEQFGGE